ncbi:hypothetical protein ACLOJK_014550, partial [Asimina triloba]
GEGRGAYMLLPLPLLVSRRCYYCRCQRQRRRSGGCWVLPNFTIDGGDGLQSRQIWNPSLAAYLLDGSNQPIGASPVVEL